MAGIFISYRRDDSAPWAGRVYERLAQDFKRDQIFMDVDNIAPGLDFLKELERSVGQCDAVVAVIGKGWAEARNSKGERRLDDPRDFVRIELEAALARDIRVIPVLVDGASMPNEDELPERMRPLIYRNAVELTHARFGSDVQRLVGALKPVAVDTAQDKATTVANVLNPDWLGRLGLALTFAAASAWILTLSTGISIVGAAAAVALTTAVVALARAWNKRHRTG